MKLPALDIRTEKQTSKSTFALLLAWMLILTPSMVRAQNNSQAAKPVATSPSNPAQKPVISGQLRGDEKSESAGGPREGIKVHGHWVIEVRNPDGTLAARREFENALQDPRILVRLLTRQFSPGTWEVTLLSSGPTEPCSAAGQNQACGIYEGTPSDILSGTATAATTLTVTPFITSPVHFELQGTATATANSTIDIVETNITLCPASVAPATPCLIGSTGYFGFTRATAGPSTFNSVPVSMGQIIQVKVSISFS